MKFENLIIFVTWKRKVRHQETKTEEVQAQK
jgi:hypothetical protein